VNKTHPRPQHVNNDNNISLPGLSSPGTGSCSLIAKAADGLTAKLRGVYSWLIGVREDGSVFKIPATARGNETYAYYQNARIQQIQESLKNKIRIEGNTTNALFITLTQKYNKNSIEEINKSWYNTKKALNKFKRKMRTLGMTDYVMTLEAHEAGGCHAHMATVFNRPLKTFIAREEKRRLVDIELLYKIKKAWSNALGYEMDEAFSDIVACSNNNLIGYIVKELKKTSSCEKAIKNIKAGRDTPADRKKVMAFYLADKHKMRLLYVSKGISADAEPEEGEPPDSDLITNVISEQAKTPRVLYTINVRRIDLLKLINNTEISPYTGTVDNGTKEYDALMDIFEERYKISKVLGNEKEIERIIAEHQERIMVKRNTKTIAQEAIDE
jgi:hypothetical protein